MVDWRDLSVAWVDFTKAFDMIPHQWIMDMLVAIRALKGVTETMRVLLPKWKTDVEVRMESGETRRFPVDLRRGIFQGDSMSPLLFCLAVAPVSFELRKAKEDSKKSQ